jgi:cytidylate kinase
VVLPAAAALAFKKVFYYPLTTRRTRILKRSGIEQSSKRMLQRQQQKQVKQRHLLLQL